MKTPQIVPTAATAPRASGSDSTPSAAAPEPLALPIPPTHRATLEAFGTENLLALIADGHSHARIADLLAVDPGALGNYLTQHADRALFSEAYRRSAEALTDAAEATIASGDAETITGPQVAYLKLKADFLMRKAGQRNARYRDKAPADDGQAPTAPTAPPSFVLVVHGSAEIEGRRVATLENDPDGGT